MQADALYFRKAETLEGDIGRQLKSAILAMALGYFDHAEMILELPQIVSHLAATYGLTLGDVVAPASRAYGRMAYWRAFAAQLRGLVPFLRHIRHILRG